MGLASLPVRVSADVAALVDPVGPAGPRRPQLLVHMPIATTTGKQVDVVALHECGDAAGDVAALGDPVGPAGPRRPQLLVHMPIATTTGKQVDVVALHECGD